MCQFYQQNCTDLYVIHCKSGSSGLIYLQQIIKQGKLQQVPHNLSD